MATIIIDMESNADVRRVAAAMRQLKGVAKVRVQKDDFERIPGLPYTHEERIAAIQRAEEDYAAGRFVTSDELKAKHPRV